MKCWFVWDGNLFHTNYVGALQLNLQWMFVFFCKNPCQFEVSNKNNWKLNKVLISMKHLTVKLILLVDEVSTKCQLAINKHHTYKNLGEWMAIWMVHLIIFFLPFRTGEKLCEIGNENQFKRRNVCTKFEATTTIRGEKEQNTTSKRRIIGLPYVICFRFKMLTLETWIPQKRIFFCSLPNNIQ